MTPGLFRELAHLFEVESRNNKELAAIADELRRRTMTEEKKKEDLEIGGIVKMSTLKKLLKVALVAGLGFFIGRKTA